MKKWSLLLLAGMFLLQGSMCGTEPPAAGMDGDEVVRVVSPDGSGDHLTVQAAFDEVPEGNTKRWVIHVKPGRYFEKLKLEKGRDHVVLVGEDALTTVLTYDDYAGRDDMGTFLSQSVSIEADDFMAVGITFENTFVNSKENTEINPKTQGVALKITGDRAALYDCRLVGNQDTFLGWDHGRIYLRNCYIEGNVDFIFGNSVMVFDRCTTYVNRNYSVLTAAATPADQAFGFVFLDCELETMPVGSMDFNGTPFDHFYLGRPWQETPKVVFIRCSEPASLHPDGWTTMAVEADLFAEYACTGAGAADSRLAQRKMGGRQLTDAEAVKYRLENIFSKATSPHYSADWMPGERYELGGKDRK